MSNIPFFSADGHLDELGIALYTDALSVNTTAAVPTDIVRHVEECDFCKQHILAVSELIDSQAIQTLKHQPNHDTAIQPTFGTVFWYRAAAVVLFFFISSSAYFFVSQQNADAPVVTIEHPRHDQTTASEPTNTPQKHEPILADNFSSSPNLEGMLRTDFRSSSIDVISPEIGEIVRPPITFRWKETGHPMKLKILTNKEVTILTAIVPADSFRSAKQFNAGLYYWKLELNDELLYLGKFFVK